MTIRTENWNRYDIRFVEIGNEWWAILKDICDALDLQTFKISQRIPKQYLKKVLIESENKQSAKGRRSSQKMLIINEVGIYQLFYTSRKEEAINFRAWSGEVMKKLRRKVGLESYSVMHMLDTDVQESINDILDTLFYDEESGKLMQSVTVAGGDVDVIEFE